MASSRPITSLLIGDSNRRSKQEKYRENSEECRRISACEEKTKLIAMMELAIHLRVIQ